MFSEIGQRINYLMTLPERTVRSVVAIATGTSSLLTETLFPEALRGTTLYRIFVGDVQDFMTTKVAEVQRGTDQAAEEQREDYLSRKVVGGALETAGLFAMHVSPLWVFAIAGDAAAGSSVFLERLVVQLKKNNVLPQDAQVQGLEDLLSSLQEVSRRGSTAVDTPPLSSAEVSKLAEEMNFHFGQLFERSTDLIPRLEDIWTRMEKLADRENVSIERLGGILTVQAAGVARKGFGSALAVGQTGAGLLGETILDNYSKTLDHVSEVGVAGYVSNHMQPFLQAASSHFDPARKTWTAKVISKLSGFIGLGSKEAESAVPAETTAPVAETKLEFKGVPFRPGCNHPD
jgi:hypothetical protein